MLSYAPVVSWLSCLCLIVSSGAAQGQEGGDPGAKLPAWVNNVQTYGMLPVTPEEALEMNVSVNGAWAGFGGSDPILPHPGWISTVAPKFGDDAKAFAEACHQAGLLVVCGINGVEGMGPLREERVPNWEQLACRNADGLVVNWMSPDDIIMCTNNPGWIQFELEYGKEGIDNGADLILLDTPQGGAVASGLPVAGFCDACMKTFKRWLIGKYSPGQLKERFSIGEFDKKEIIERLRLPANPAPEDMLYASRVKKDPLFAEFIACQEEASFNTRKQLLDALRDYARSKGRAIVTSTNTVNLGTGNPLGHWIRGLMFTDIVDLFVYEISHCPDGSLAKEILKPRGKWTAFHRLAYSVYGRRSAAVISSGTIARQLAPALQGRVRLNAWLGVLAAEAYASNGAYIMYYFEAPPGNQEPRNLLWTNAMKICGYVQDNRDLYEGSLRSGSEVAILFLENDRGRTIPAAYPSYFGLAQAFTEGNFPFDVVFGGDGKYVADTLTEAALEPYKALIVPSPVDPTENQQRLLEEFVRAGGVIVCHEPQRLGFQGEFAGGDVRPPLEGVLRVGRGSVLRMEGEISETSMSDAASRYFYDYDEGSRQQLYALADQLGLTTVLPDNDDGLVCAFQVHQPEQKRVVVHLVNYDVDAIKDAIRPQKDIAINIVRPVFLRGPVRAKLYAPGDPQPQSIEVEGSDGVLTCTAHNLATTATLVLSPQ